MAHQRSAAARYRSRLTLVLAISTAVFGVELVAGLATNSLALLADAGHVFADMAGTGVSLLAIWLAARPPTSTRSFGLYRLEIVAATANALLLFGISGLVLYEGIRRLQAPPDLSGAPVIAVAAFGLLANGIAALLLSRGRHESLTVRAAYLEILGDLLGSVASWRRARSSCSPGLSGPMRWRPSSSRCSSCRGRGDSCATASTCCWRPRRVT